MAAGVTRSRLGPAPFCDVLQPQGPWGRGDRQRGPARGSAAASAIHEPLAKESRCCSQAVRSDPRAAEAPGPEARMSSRTLAASLMEASPFQPPQTHSPALSLTSLTHTPPLAPRPSLAGQSWPSTAAGCICQAPATVPSPVTCPWEARGLGSQGHVGTRQPLPSHLALEALPFWPSGGRTASEPSPTPAQRKAWAFQSLSLGGESDYPTPRLQQGPPRVRPWPSGPGEVGQGQRGARPSGPSCWSHPNLCPEAASGQGRPLPHVTLLKGATWVIVKQGSEARKPKSMDDQHSPRAEAQEPDEKQWPPGAARPVPRAALLSPWSHRPLPKASFLEEAPLLSCSQPLEGKAAAHCPA